MAERKTKLLLVEDNPGDVRLIQEMIKQAGAARYELSVAGTLDGALDCLRKAALDAVLLDLNLPDSQGIITLKSIRGNAPRMALVVITGLNDDATAIESLKMGAEDFLVKGGFDSSILVRSLRYAIERKRAEEAVAEILRKSEENYRRSLSDSPLGVRIVSADGKLLYANQAILDIYGYGSVEELKTTPHKEIYTPQSYAEHLVRKEQRQRGEYVASNYEISIIRKDGEIRYLDVFRKEVLWNGEKQFQVIYNDVTERKRAEEALRESEKKYRLLAENASDVIAVMDMNLRPVYMSPSTTRLLGYTVEEAMARGIEVSLTPESLKVATKAFAATMPGKQAEKKLEPVTIDLEYIRKDGSTVWVSTSVNILYGPDGQPVEILSILHDITDRKQAENQLRETNEYLENLINYANAPIIVWNREMKITRFNRASESLTGRKATDVIGKSLEILFPAGRVETSVELIKNTMAGERWESVEIGILHRDGSIRNVIWNSATIMADDGKTPVATIAQGQDITERKAAEEALRESERKFREMAELLPEVIFECDVQGKLTFANEAAFRKFGYSQEDFNKGVIVQQFIAPADMKKAEENIGKIMCGTEKGPFEYTALRKDGSEFPVIVYSSAIIHEGRPLGLRGIIVDITERKAAEKTLLLFQKSVESASDAIGISDPQGHHVYNNKAFNEMFGYAVDDLEAAGDGPAVYVDKNVAREVFKTIMDGRSWSGEAEMLSKSGRRLSVLLRADAIKDESGKVIGLMGVHTDITERKNNEEELRTYKNHLEELVKERTAELEDTNVRLNEAKSVAEKANKAKSDFLANMSHEIRTPLSTIIGFSELLSDETKGLINDDQKKYLGYVTSSGQHLLSLINDILDLSKVEAGKMDLLPTAFSISDLLKNSLSFVVEKALKHNIKLRSEISADVDMVEADERKVKQIIYNLLSNAVKFTPDGGSVTIGAEVVSPKSTVLPAKIRKGLPDTKYVLVSIKDTGIGIAKKDQPRLFTEFSQIEEPYAKKYEGTGLGLALSKRLVALHGGSIWFESKGKGKGCTFSFVLPLKPLPDA